MDELNCLHSALVTVQTPARRTGRGKARHQERRLRGSVFVPFGQIVKLPLCPYLKNGDNNSSLVCVCELVEITHIKISNTLLGIHEDSLNNENVS